MNSFRYFDFGSSKPLVLLVARIAIVLLSLIFGFPKMMGFNETIGYMASVNAPFPPLAATIAVIMEVPVAILVVLGFFTRPLAIIFIFYTIAAGFIGHHYWTMTGADAAGNMINFYKNISIAAGFLLLALVGPGKYSIDRR